MSRQSQTVGWVAKRVPLVRRLPIMRVLLIGEIALIARTHIERLTPQERRRIVVLLRDARGRPSALSPDERAELEALVAKAEPKLFAAAAAHKLSPVTLPQRFLPRRDS
jgi:hypothetical protein